MSCRDLIIGANGAGQTTLFERVIVPARPGLPFVNADRIATARFGTDAERRSYEAVVIATRTRATLIDARLDICTETVSSHRSKLELVRNAVDVVAHVVMIPLSLCEPRVVARVAAGGHSVPVSKLARRFERLWPNVVTMVPMCHRSVFWDNSHDTGPLRSPRSATALPTTRHAGRNGPS